MSETNYAWAANPAKLKQAIVAAGSTASEEVVRSEYEKRGGLIINNENAMSESTEDIKVEETVEVSAPAAPEPTVENEAPVSDAVTAPVSEPVAEAVA